MPVPFCVRFPVPLIEAVLKSVPWVTVFERLKTSVPTTFIDPLVESEPLAPPAPSCKVPALTLVNPV